jgi:hypothetical protein
MAAPLAVCQESFSTKASHQEKLKMGQQAHYPKQAPKS